MAVEETFSTATPDYAHNASHAGFSANLAKPSRSSIGFVTVNG